LTISLIKQRLTLTVALVRVLSKFLTRILHLSIQGCVAKNGRLKSFMERKSFCLHLMNPKTPFKWRHYQPEIILLCVRWYLRYPLSYRNLEEMITERGLKVDHSTVYRWVQVYAPELEKRCRPHLKPTNDSWRVDETYSLPIVRLGY